MGRNERRLHRRFVQSSCFPVKLFRHWPITQLRQSRPRRGRSKSRASKGSKDEKTESLVSLFGLFGLLFDPRLTPDGGQNGWMRAPLHQRESSKLAPTFFSSTKHRPCLPWPCLAGSYKRGRNHEARRPARPDREVNNQDQRAIAPASPPACGAAYRPSFFQARGHLPQPSHHNCGKSYLIPVTVSNRFSPDLVLFLFPLIAQLCMAFVFVHPRFLAA